MIVSSSIYGCNIFSVAKSYNCFNARNCIGLHSFSISNHPSPFFERHECFGTRRNLFFTTFVCCFHLHKLVVIIVFIAMRSFHCIGIFTVFLLLHASQGSTCFRSCFCFPTVTAVVHTMVQHHVLLLISSHLHLSNSLIISLVSYKIFIIGIHSIE